MSRDLSYRVWDNHKKEYSDSVFSIDQNGILWVQDEDGYGEQASDRYIIEFSTGLKDKNGKRIREGDVVELDWYICGDKPAYKVKSEVIFDEEGVRVCNGKHSDLLKYCTGIEVIGNIHENPELLGGEDE